MDNLRSQFNIWFAGITPRERIMVIVAATFVIGAIIWLAALQPLYQGTAQAELRVADKTALLSELQVRAARYRGPSAGTQVQGLDQSIVVVIDRTSRLSGLSDYLKRNQPEDNNTVRLRFENAPFDDLVKWMAEVRSGYGLTASSASFDIAGSPGRVNCSLVLNRSGG